MTHAPNFDVGGGCDPYFTIKDGVSFETLYNYKKDKNAAKVVAWKKEATRELVCNVDVSAKNCQALCEDTSVPPYPAGERGYFDHILRR